jgi:preprotein translocase subunit SecG
VSRDRAKFEQIRMQTVVIVVHLMIVLALVGAVLLQKSEGGGLGIGGGGGGGFLSSRGTSNVLTRTTAILAASFFATSLVLSILASMDRKPTTIIRSTTGAPPVPGAPGTPAPTSGGVLDTLRQQEQPPAGPQVPRSQ